MTQYLLEGIETPRKGRFSWASLLGLLGAVALGASWLLPNHYVPWYFFHSDAMAFIAVFAWLVSIQLRGEADEVVPRVVIVILLAVAIPWAQWAAGLLGFAGEAWVATLYLGGLAASVLVGFRWARQANGEAVLLETIVAATFIGGFISTGLSLAQWLRLEDALGIFVANLGDTARPFANLAQPNLLATLLVMSVVAAAWLYESNRIGRWGLATAVLFLTVGLCLTQSRAGYLSAAVVCAWWIFKARTVSARRLELWWAPGWLLAIALVAFGLHHLSAAFDLADDRAVAIYDNNGRWLMWKQIARGILESPWGGYGWEHTTAAQMTGAISHPGDLATAYAHDIFLDMFAWLGIPLGLAVCVAAVWWVGSRALQTKGRVGVFAFALALPVLAHSVVEFPFAYAVFLFPAGIMLGAVEGASVRTRAAVLQAWRRHVAMALTLGWAALGVQVVREYGPAEDDFRFLRFEAMHMGKTPGTHSRPSFVLLSQMAGLLDVGRIQPHPGMTDQEIGEVRNVTLRYPWAPPAVLYAAVLEANGRQAEADRQLEVIRGMYGPRYFADAKLRLDDLRTHWQEPASAGRR
jgi:O-antigen ligase